MYDNTLKFILYSIGLQLFLGSEPSSRARKKLSTQSDGVERSDGEFLFGTRNPIFFKHAWIMLPVRRLPQN